MSEGIILDAEDVKKIIAEKFGVDPKGLIVPYLSSYGDVSGTIRVAYIRSSIASVL